MPQIKQNQIKIKAFYHETISGISTRPYAETANLFLNIRDKILQDIIFRNDKIIYSSQIKLIGEYQVSNQEEINYIKINGIDVSTNTFEIDLTNNKLTQISILTSTTIDETSINFSNLNEFGSSGIISFPSSSI